MQSSFELNELYIAVSTTQRKEKKGKRQLL